MASQKYRSIESVIVEFFILFTILVHTAIGATVSMEAFSSMDSYRSRVWEKD